MPGGDRTGPTGQGPRSGWGMGFCSGADKPGFVNAALGRVGRGGGRGQGGSGRGGGNRGGGWRWRNWFHATGLTGWQRGAGATTPESAPTGSAAAVAAVAAMGSRQEIELLKQQAAGTIAALDEIRERIDQIQAQLATPQPGGAPTDGQEQ